MRKERYRGMKKVITRGFLSASLLFVLMACGSKINVTVSENIEVEYGEKLDNTLLFNKEKSDENLTVKEVKDFDNKKLGEQEITVIFALEDKTQEEKVKVNVKDTKAPEIKLKKDKLEITEGDKFDPASNIESVKDPVDGDIKKSDDKKITKNGYIITSDVDAKKVKNGYKVKVTAFDVNGNKAEKEYTVNVKAKPEEKPQASTSQSTTSGGQAASATPAPSTSQGGSSNAGGGSQSATSPAPANVCPRTGQAPRDPSKSCDEVLRWAVEPGGYNPQIRFNTIDEAYAWGDEQMMNNPEYYKKFTGFGTSNVCTNDEYCDWGQIWFYKEY